MIGIFDSGLGGLTVMREVMAHLPGYDLIYFGDTARTPYGSKSPDTVIQYALQIGEWLVDKGADLIVTACNTVSSLATKTLRERFDVPIFEVVSPAVGLVAENRRIRRAGVIGTRATIDSGVYERMIRAKRPDISIYSRACPLLVPLVEEGWSKRAETKRIVKKYLYPLRLKQIDTLILGCTHYPILKDVIRIKAGKRVRIIDSSEAIAAAIKGFLEEHPEIEGQLNRNSAHTIYVSDITEHFRRIAQDILGIAVRLEHVRL
ncbi:MAG: glutamate racemase [Desulfobacterales bacterium]|nr:glutamate racemase [Desulfobacterales bacterium]